MNGSEQEAGRSQGQCSKCSQPLTPETTVHLWDGKDYCRGCVEAACPGMAEYARTHVFLEETMPYDGRRTELSMRELLSNVVYGGSGGVGLVLLFRLGVGSDSVAEFHAQDHVLQAV